MTASKTNESVLSHKNKLSDNETMEWLIFAGLFFVFIVILFGINRLQSVL